MTSDPEVTRFQRLIAPESIAIVGVSADSAKHGHRVYRNLRRLDFPGPVWGVNPNLPDVAGMETFARLEQLPAVPDLVVSAVPGRSVPQVAADAAAVGAGAVIVFAAGFAESGDDGAELQTAVADAIAGTPTRVLGPNSGGVIVPSAGLAASFLTCLDRPVHEIRTGAVGLVTQSGGTGSYLHNLAASTGGGLAASISTGNEVDIDLADGVAALTELDAVRAIALVIETVRNGQAFLAAVAAAHDAGKPVVLCHLGRTGPGAGMLDTHTGALATDSRVLMGVCDSMGIAEAATPGELLEVAEAMARAKSATGDRVGVVTHSGGVAVLLADLAADRGLRLPSPRRELAAELEPLLDLGAATNPLDMGAILGGPNRFAEAVEIFARDHDIVLAVSSAHPPAHSEMRATALAGLARRPPIVHLWMAGDVGREGERVLRAADLPVTVEPRAAISTVEGLIRLGRPRAQPRRTLSGGRRRLSEHQSKMWLEDHGFPVVPGELATTPAGAARIATRLGGTLVAKLASPDVVHKAAVGGVRLGLSGPAEAQRAFEEIIAAAASHGLDGTVEGVRIEREAPGIEMIAAGFIHPRFGPMVSVGVGGRDVEVMRDVEMALAPPHAAQVHRLLGRLRGSSLLDSAVFGEVPDRDELVELVMQLGQLVAEGAAVEIEINPLAWTSMGWLGLDAIVRAASG